MGTLTEPAAPLAAGFPAAPATGPPVPAAPFAALPALPLGGFCGLGAPAGRPAVAIPLATLPLRPALALAAFGTVPGAPTDGDETDAFEGVLMPSAEQAPNQAPATTANARNRPLELWIELI